MRKSGSAVVAANGGTTGNVLSGSVLEIIRSRAQVKVYAAASAAGLTASMSSGPEIVLEGGSAVSQANRFPVIPDDLLCSDVAMPNDRLNLTFTNPTAGALTVYWTVDSTPV